VEKTSYEPGEPSWIDLGTPDPAVAGAFYSALFGWEMQDLGPDAGGYSMATLQGANVAGIGPQANTTVPPYWTTYFATADVEATAARVVAHGGAIVAEPMDVFDAGRMAVFVDPAGAPFSAWQAGSHHGAGRAYETGTMCWHELKAHEPVGPSDFYGRVFGWTVTAEDMDGSAYHVWHLGESSIGGMSILTGEAAGTEPASWTVYFAVDETDATVARALALGGSVVAPAMDIQPGRFAILADPYGAAFGVIQPPEGVGTDGGSGESAASAQGEESTEA
jgi:predicted enzyme related to lactoylglutathione lyase